jgi:hypothetical protein
MTHRTNVIGSMRREPSRRIGIGSRLDSTKKPLDPREEISNRTQMPNWHSCETRSANAAARDWRRKKAPNEANCQIDIGSRTDSRRSKCNTVERQLETAFGLGFSFPRSGVGMPALTLCVASCRYLARRPAERRASNKRVLTRSVRTSNVTNAFPLSDYI